MTDTTAPLWGVLIQRMSWFTVLGVLEVGEHPVDEHSGGPAPQLRLEGIEHRRGDSVMKHVQRPRPLKVGVRTAQPLHGGLLPPDQPRLGEHGRSASPAAHHRTRRPVPVPGSRPRDHRPRSTAPPARSDALSAIDADEFYDYGLGRPRARSRHRSGAPILYT